MRFNDLIEIDARNRLLDEEKDAVSYLTCPNEDDFRRDDEEEKIALTDDNETNSQPKRILLLEEFV